MFLRHHPEGEYGAGNMIVWDTGNLRDEEVQRT